MDDVPYCGSKASGGRVIDKGWPGGRHLTSAGDLLQICSFGSYGKVLNVTCTTINFYICANMHILYTITGISIFLRITKLYQSNTILQWVLTDLVGKMYASAFL